MSSIKKLVHIAKMAPIPNQNIKKPTVAISIMKKIPAAINQIYHIKPPLKNLLYYYEIIIIKIPP